MFEKKRFVDFAFAVAFDVVHVAQGSFFLPFLFSLLIISLAVGWLVGWLYMGYLIITCLVEDEGGDIGGLKMF